MGRNVSILFNVTLVSMLCPFPHQSSAQEGVEVRAARVCAGIGQQGGNFQGAFNVGNLSVQGSANGTVTVKRDGVDLGKIEQGAFRDYTSCLIEVIKLVSPRPPSFHWKAVRVDDCGGNDAFCTPLSSDPENNKCNEARLGRVAVCWSNGANKNIHGPPLLACSNIDNWCTYKLNTISSCTGGTRKGTMYECVRE